MTPCMIVSMPHNRRDPLYSPGDAPDTFCNDRGEPRPSPFGANFADLPIKMPASLLAFTDSDGKVIAAWADGRRVRWRDLDTVVTGVKQFNVHCRQMGVTAPPPPPADADDDRDAGC
jgi:hypothetical protein